MLHPRLGCNVTAVTSPALHLALGTEPLHDTANLLQIVAYAQVTLIALSLHGTDWPTPSELDASQLS